MPADEHDFDGFVEGCMRAILCGRGTTTIAGCFVLATLGSSTVTSAQAVSSFRDLRVSLKGGERLEMTETSGVTTEGRFVALSDQSLRVSAESARHGSTFQKPQSRESTF